MISIVVTENGVSNIPVYVLELNSSTAMEDIYTTLQKMSKLDYGKFSVKMFLECVNTEKNMNRFEQLFMYVVEENEKISGCKYPQQTGTLISILISALSGIIVAENVVNEGEKECI